MTPPLELLISDIDGTLVTPDKTLTPRAQQAAQRLSEAGVAFSLISSRPARGMAHLVEQLRVSRPIASFNGANIVGVDGHLISALRLPAGTARTTLALLARRGVDAWVFADDAWFLTNPNGSKVAREQHTVGFGPTVVADFDAVIDRIDKLVGVSDDHDLLAKTEVELHTALGETAIAVRSQPYYLDVTNAKADKGHGVLALCAAMGVDPARTAVIGDMSNDVAMFRVAGFSVAMGQAPDAVKAEADAVTGPNTEDGFAEAVERLILPRAGR
jgi:Cof subfamily protein (haloacid dehalogenase superfamily)